ncbi:hypothetical protein LMH73_016905 [Vibrio splendidus]|nr:hypothetical protein [Vibrio splendidus]MCC4881837.1 hypothetical protein [Vibrio splendidus]
MSELTDLQKLTKTYDELEIKYAIRENGKYQVIFIGDRQDIYEPNGTFEDGDINTLMARHKFMEFLDGELIGYLGS